MIDIKEIENELERERELLKRLEAVYPELPAGYIEERVVNGTRRVYLTRERRRQKSRCAVNEDYPEFDKLLNEVRLRSDIYHAMPRLRKNVAACEDFLGRFSPYDPYAIAGSHAPDPVLFPAGKISDDEWAAAAAPRNGFRPGDYRYETKRGEKVRSKSELMIADVLFEAGLDYRSDCLLMVGGLPMYPDFQILRRSDHRVILWEHNGFIGDEGYVYRSYARLETYNRAGYYIGENLIVTSESASMPLTRSEIFERLRMFRLVR